MFRVVSPPIIRSAYNCIYSMWYLSHCYCYLPLSWKSWNRFECAVGGVQIPDAVDKVVCATDDGWKYHSKHVEQFPDLNKLCNVASGIYIGILLGYHPILHISRIQVNLSENNCIKKSGIWSIYTINYMFRPLHWPTSG
jgi:hypothetical protein